MTCYSRRRDTAELSSATADHPGDRTDRGDHERILAAIELGLSDSKLEA